MEFGQVPYEDLDKIDFTLPTDPSFNQKVLNRELSGTRAFVGLAKWGREEWVGRLYPSKTKEKDFLKENVNHFNCIEYNSSHYKIYGFANSEQKANIVKGKDFLFFPKMFQGITHRGTLKGKQFLLNEFLRGIAGLREHLGGILIQLSDTFSPKRKEELFAFLNELPNDLQFFLEVRHPLWFQEIDIREQLFSKLRSLNIGSVITDTPGRRDCSHMHLSIDKAFIRYVSAGHNSDKTRIADWSNRINYWKEKGIKEIYFFIHMHNEVHTPELAKLIIEELNNKCNLELKEIQLLK
jgi:uncharacterized protein YecE (DUF72 family)